MVRVFCNDAVEVGKGILGLRERDAMLLLVFQVFVRVPFEVRLLHVTSLSQEGRTAIFFYGREYGRDFVTLTVRPERLAVQKQVCRMSFANHPCSKYQLVGLAIAHPLTCNRFATIME